MTSTLTHGFTQESITQIAERTGEPSAITDARRVALKRHEALDGPIQGQEAWKHDDLHGFDLDRYAPDTEVLEIEGADAVRAAGGLVAPLTEAFGDDRVRDAFIAAAFADSDTYFWALAVATVQTGAVVVVPRGALIVDPIVLRRRIERSGSAIGALTFILVEDGASVTVIDRADGDPGDALAIHPTLIRAGGGANVTYLAVQEYGENVWQFAQTRAHIGQDATCRTLTATIGAKHARSVTEAELEGRGASAELLGFSFGDHDQFVDHRTLQHHLAPDTTSELSYKGALTGTARSVYTGLVDIEHEATGSAAAQTSRNLLLSSTARADASPFLEIKTSEVERATHAVSVGRPDSEALFYLQSRGLDEGQAMRLFVTGFFQELIDRVPVGDVRTVLEQLVATELDQGALA